MIGYCDSRLSEPDEQSAVLPSRRYKTWNVGLWRLRLLDATPSGAAVLPLGMNTPRCTELPVSVPAGAES